MPRPMILIGIIACLGCGGCASQRLATSLGIKRERPTIENSSLSLASTSVDLQTEGTTGHAAQREAIGDRILLASVQTRIENSAGSPSDRPVATPVTIAPLVRETEPVPLNPASDASSVDISFDMHPQQTAELGGQSASARQTDVLALNLPSALAMVDSQHPAVAMAQWRVREAYARLDQAQALWLPTIQAGLSFNRHDGNLQASDGSILDVNRNSFQAGLGAGAVGAGTTPRPGLIAEFHLADALLQPQIAERNAWSRQHAAQAVTHNQLLAAATAYNDLVGADQGLEIVEASRARMADLFKITQDFAEAGQGLQADADRVQTELLLLDNQLVAARECIALASAALAQTLSMDACIEIIPMDAMLVPIQMTATSQDRCCLIRTGLATRPELKESQALVAAACEAYQREKLAPFVPSLLLGFSTGGFGGGLGDQLDNFDNRYDLDALMTWQVRNLGLGERASRRQSAAQIQQAKFEQLRVLDQVAREVTDAYTRVHYRVEQIAATQRAIAAADHSFARNLDRIRDGQGIPLEALQSSQALDLTQQAYLRAVLDYNQAQYQLQWALGWPLSSLN